MGWRNDVRLEIMDEARSRQRCRRCGNPAPDSDNPICDQCRHDEEGTMRIWRPMMMSAATDAASCSNRPIRSMQCAHAIMNTGMRSILIWNWQEDDDA